jgi:hypothetical protein
VFITIQIADFENHKFELLPEGKLKFSYVPISIHPFQNLSILLTKYSLNLLFSADSHG